MYISLHIYLRSQLKGLAYKAVEGILNTEQNYDIAVNRLKERYGDTSLLSAAYVQQLIEVKPVQNSQDIVKL